MEDVTEAAKLGSHKDFGLLVREKGPLGPYVGLLLFSHLAFMQRLPIILLLASCGIPDTPDNEAAIRQVMADQEVAWDRGDIPGFMEGYADTVCFISSKGRTCGREAVTANYLRNYPDKSAMGDLAFDIHEVVPAGTGHAWMTGTWKLYRTADTLGGGFSLLWVKQQPGWRIARDHTY